MPKKSASARSGAQRKAKAQKRIELVRPASILDEQQSDPEESESTEKPVVAPAKAKVAATIVEERPAEQEKETSTAPKGSAAARLAARRQASQRAHQRNAATLITPEHFAYVRRDLITISVLAVVMITIILVSYYFLVIRA
jgi:hypothetical protein